jgi:tetrahydromethanopterin S-methyltransferase subunit G
VKAEVQQGFGRYHVQRVGVDVGVLYLADVLCQVCALFPAVFAVDFARIGSLGGAIGGVIS